MKHKHDVDENQAAHFTNTVSKRFKYQGKDCIFDMIDDSVLSQIFSYIIRAPDTKGYMCIEKSIGTIDCDSIINLQCVCRRFYSVSSNSFIWQEARFSGVSKSIHDYERICGPVMDVIRSHLIGFQKINKEVDDLSSGSNDVCYRVMLKSTREYYLLKVPRQLVTRNERMKQNSSLKIRNRSRVNIGAPVSTIYECAKEQELSGNCDILISLQNSFNLAKGIIPIGGKAIRIYEEFRSLSNFIQENKKKIEFNSMRHIISQILIHTALIHSRGIVHNNLSTDTVVITGGPVQNSSSLTIKLSCGLSQKRRSCSLQHLNLCSCSVEKNRNVDRSYLQDIFAIGNIFLELLLNYVSFRKRTVAKRLVRIIKQTSGSERITQEFMKKFQAEKRCIQDSFNAVDQSSFDLLELLYGNDPNHRISVANILKHPFFNTTRCSDGSSEAPPRSISFETARMSDIIAHHRIIEDSFYCNKTFTYINDRSWVGTVEWCFLAADLLEMNRRLPFVAMSFLIRVCSNELFLGEILNLCHNVDENLMQLVASTCLYIASKIEGTSNINLKDIVCIADNTFIIQDVIAMEEKILDILRWELFSSINVLDFVNFMIGSLKEFFNNDAYIAHAKFFSEIMLLSPLSQTCSPSILAVCCITLVHISYNKSLKEWSHLMPRMTGYEWENVVEFLCILHADLKSVGSMYPCAISIQKSYEKIGIDTSLSFDIVSAVTELVASDSSQ